jgi:hypothetical protein
MTAIQRAQRLIWVEDLFAWLFGLLIFGFLFPIIPPWLYNSNRSGQYSFGDIIFSADALIGSVVICSAIFIAEATARPRRFFALVIIGAAFVLGGLCAFEYTDFLSLANAPSASQISGNVSNANSAKVASAIKGVAAETGEQSPRSGLAKRMGGYFAIFVSLFALAAKFTEHARSKTAEANIDALGRVAT